MSTPWSIKLNHPNIFAVKDILIKGVIRQLDHVLFTRTVASALSQQQEMLNDYLVKNQHHYSK